METAGGLDIATGKAYLDRRFDFLSFTSGSDFSYYSGDMDLYRAAAILKTAGVTTVEDNNDAEIGFAILLIRGPQHNQRAKPDDQ